ncbi:MBL fold hydrolase [Lachnoclostridium sp. An196]|uniref:MBL fold metallo-hydrolase RNA specificity domain-containing protein n=1 Tax=Lachnoclostridium sp. An196 TaxID=1965583 RepID=UPI000B38EAF7|nr:MBL fold metallo-hydrolase [Lachnoclostridium sp. An196]OUP20825.1 MBL fold hydrolase [Lachnoclostridium sp. An196]
MKLGFLGADHEVTGSCHYVEACGRHILIDCGLEQGRDVYVNQDIPVPVNQIDCVLLTHAHIDHSGRLPLLYKNGFRGEIIATFATNDLCSIMLRDSAHIQEFEAEWRNRKAKRSGAEEYVPLYTMDDALGAISLFHPCDYEQKIEIFPGVQARFRDVGHLLGSASIELWIKEEDIERKLVFSGDIGNINQPLIKDPKTTDSADYVIMESTYGNRTHNAPPDYVTELAGVIDRTLRRGGNLVIPAFAVGRTQEMLYFIRDIKERRLINFDFPVYVDSPLAIEATTIFGKNVQSCFDEDAMALIRQGINPIRFPNLRLAISSEDSKAINFDPTPKVIISASGMCEAGRVKHHLKHNLWRPESAVLFVGYQAYNTLGRSLLEGAEYVKIFGETIEVKAEIVKLEGVSGHADQNGLLRWAGAFQPAPRMVFVVHGEDEVCDEFASLLTEKYGAPACAPFSGALYDLAAGVWIKEGLKIPVAAEKPSTKRKNEVFARLVEAGKRLMQVIYHNEGGANKDLAKFTSQIQSLCDKWDR